MEAMHMLIFVVVAALVIAGVCALFKRSFGMALGLALVLNTLFLFLTKLMGWSNNTAIIGLGLVLILGIVLMGVKKRPDDDSNYLKRRAEKLVGIKEGEGGPGADGRGPKPKQVIRMVPTDEGPGVKPAEKPVAKPRGPEI